MFIVVDRSFRLLQFYLSFVFILITNDIPKILSQEPLLLLNKSTLQRPVGWRCLHHRRGLTCN